MGVGVGVKQRVVLAAVVTLATPLGGAAGIKVPFSVMLLEALGETVRDAVDKLPDTCESD